MKTNLIIKFNKISLFFSKCSYRTGMNYLGKIISYPRIKLTQNALKSIIPETLSKNYDYSNLKELTNSEQKIFIMWFQGEEKMPPIIKKCFNSIKKYFSDREIILITESNLNDYITLEPIILDKYKKGYISRTTLSDIIRAKLLYKYGGMWIDSTIFLSKAFDDSYFNSELYGPCGIKSEMNKDWAILFDRTNGWNGWCMGSNKIHYPFFDFLYNAFVEFYSKEDFILDYFQIDFFTRLFYDSNSHFKNLIQTRFANNIYSHDLARTMNKKITPKTIKYCENLLSEQPIHKLTYKRKWDLSSSGNKISCFFYNKY